MSAQSVQARSREFQFLVGLNSYNTVGLAYEVAVVVCQSQPHLLLLACDIEQCDFEEITRFLEIFVGLGLESCIGLGSNSHHHLGEVHLLGIEIGFSATQQGSVLTVILICTYILERIGTVGDNLNLIERLEIYNLVYIRYRPIHESSIKTCLETLYTIGHAAQCIEFFRRELLHLIGPQLYCLVVAWLFEHR